MSNISSFRHFYDLLNSCYRFRKFSFVQRTKLKFILAYYYHSTHYPLALLIKSITNDFTSSTPYLNFYLSFFVKFKFGSRLYKIKHIKKENINKIYRKKANKYVERIYK